MYDLTAFQRDLLYAAAGHDNPHGLALKTELDEYYGDKVNHGQLYPNLNDLVEKGLLEKSELDKRTNSYSLTSRGRREINARRNWENQYLESDS